MTTIKQFSTTVDAKTLEAVVVLGVWDSETDWQQGLPPNFRKELTLLVPGFGTESQAHIAEVLSAHDWQTASAEIYVADATGRVIEKPQKPEPFSNWDWVSCAWVDNRTLVGVRAAQWALVKASRAAALAAPLVTPQGTIQADAASQAAIDAAARYAASGNSVQWTMADNTVAQLDLPALLNVQMLLSARTQDVRGKATALRARIDARQNIADVQSVTWDASV